MYHILISPKVEIKFLNFIFDCQSFVVGSVVVEFCRFELSTSMSIVKFLSSDFFYENCS